MLYLLKPFESTVYLVDHPHALDIFLLKQLPQTTLSAFFLDQLVSIIPYQNTFKMRRQLRLLEEIQTSSHFDQDKFKLMQIAYRRQVLNRRQFGSI